MFHIGYVLVTFLIKCTYVTCYSSAPFRSYWASGFPQV